MSKLTLIETLVIDYDAFHRAYEYIVGLRACNYEIEAFENVKELNVLLEVLDHIIGEVVPSKEQIELQKANVERLGEIDTYKNRATWDRVMEQVDFFENRWC